MNEVNILYSTDIDRMIVADRASIAEDISEILAQFDGGFIDIGSFVGQIEDLRFGLTTARCRSGGSPSSRKKAEDLFRSHQETECPCEGAYECDTHERERLARYAGKIK